MGDGVPTLTNPGNSTYHTPVLCEEVIHFLVNDRSGCYVDGTVGGGGHTREICRHLIGAGEILCIDADEEALTAAASTLRDCPHIRFVQANFRELPATVRALKVRPLAGILLDLGVSSHQLDEPGRGFSFHYDAPLDMRFDRRQALSALHVVNDYEEARLADIIFTFGEERASRAIARRIFAQRPLRTTGDLAQAVGFVVRGKQKLKSLARVFQAIRIEVNRELDALELVLSGSIDLLAPDGRIAVIAYHSLEDRMVKETFRAFAADRLYSGNKLVADTPVEPKLEIITRKPVEPSAEECRANPRARSAKLRIAKRTAFAGSPHT